MSVQKTTQSINTVSVINAISERKRQNRALEDSIVHIAINQLPSDYYENGLKNIVLNLDAMDITRRFHKVNKYVERTNLPEEKRYDVYTTVRLLDAFDGYENRKEIPQSQKDLISLIVLITRRIQATTITTTSLSCALPESIKPMEYGGKLSFLTILQDKRLVLLPVETSSFKTVFKVSKKIVPIVSIYVAENPLTTPCRVVASIGAVPVYDNIADADRLRKEVDFFDRLQKQEQPRGIIETVGFDVISCSFISGVHYVQPRGVVLQNCSYKNIYHHIPKLLLDIAYGLQALHRENLAHFDVKLGNIVVFFNKTPIEARLIDLGLAASFESKLQGYIPYGTWIYTPTDYLEKSYSLKDMDLFAFGLVIYALLHNSPSLHSPFPWTEDLRLGIQLNQEGNEDWESYIDDAKKIYETTLEREEKLHLRREFGKLHSLHGLSIDLLRQCTELTINKVINSLEAMQVTAHKNMRG